MGRRVVLEALLRGHEVTAVVRRSEQLGQLPEAARGRIGDAGVAEQVVAASVGQDVVIGATRPPTGQEAQVTATTRNLLEGVWRARARLIVVGGAATLNVPGSGGRTVLEDERYLPDWARPIAAASAVQLEICLAEPRARWVYVSPPAQLEPGERTGAYRVGADELLVNVAGKSCISIEDLAVAVLDEAETPRHHQTRFTVGY